MAKRATLEQRDDVIRQLRKALNDVLTFAPTTEEAASGLPVWLKVKMHVDDLTRARAALRDAR
jgi:hypothetical protein